MPVAPGQVEHAARLVAEGWLSIGAGAALAVLGSAWVIHHHRREFAAARATPLRRWVLPAIRLCVVLLATWLLCQPRLVLIARRAQPPRVLLITDEARGMSAAEAGLRLARRAEIFAAVDPAVALPRERAAGALAAAGERMLSTLDLRRAALDRDLASLDAKLPLGADGQKRVRELGSATAAGAAALRALPAPEARAPADADPAVQRAARELSTRLPAFLAAAESLASEADLASKEASDHPQVLKDHLRHHVALRDTGRAMILTALDLQDALDRVALGPAAADALLARPVTRATIAAATAARIKAAIGDRANVDAARAEGLPDSLGQLLHAEADPLDVAILLTDGAVSSPSDQPIGPALARQAAPLAAAGTRLHAVLCGREEAEPADLALIAVDIPGLLLRDTPASARLLVKNQLPPGKAASIEIRLGDQRLASKPLDDQRRGLLVVDLSFNPGPSGRAQLVFEAHTDAPDALPGNETRHAVVDVVDAPLRVLLLADRLTDDLAAYDQALRAMPAVRLTTLLVAGANASIKLGSDEDAFPATAEDWKGVAAAVLLGDVPASLLKGDEQHAPGASVAALKEALESGRVNLLLHPLGPAGPDSWARRLGLAPERIPRPGRPAPVEGLWWDGYRAALDARASLAGWSAFDAESPASTLPDALPLLCIDQRPVVGLANRGRGAVIFNGIDSLASLRHAQTVPLLNGLVHGLVDLAARPLHEAGDERILLPRQPTAAGLIYLTGPPPPEGSGLVSLPDAPTGIAPTSTPAGKAESHPARRYRVGPVDRIRLDTAGSLTRAVEPRPSDADLHLAASAEAPRALTEATGGTLATFDDPSQVIDAVTRGLEPRPIVEADAARLWPGWWPLPLLLALVCAEYLLRRRAGRVM